MWCKKYLVITSLVALLAACKGNGEFTKIDYIPHHNWAYSNALQYDINIPDTTTRYHVNLLMQHAQEYAYSNIWLKLYTTYPSGHTDSTRLEVPLALSTGQWMGNAASNLITHTASIVPNGGTMQFSEAGHYTLRLVQDMRASPLKEVYYVGLQLQRVEK